MSLFFFLRQMIHGVLFFMCSSPLPFVSCGLKIAIVHWVLPVAVFCWVSGGAVVRWGLCALLGVGGCWVVGGWRRSL
jgi:hypothetical protein